MEQTPMFDNFILSRLKHTHQSVRARLSGEKGNILVYVVIVMVVFGLLGALMVSLFSTSIGSSATANESRRAIYLSESGIRYGASELRNNGFSTTEINSLNNTIYKLSPSGEFEIAVFGAWFLSPMDPGLNNKLFAPGDAVPLQVGKGKILSGFFEKNLPAVVSDLFIVAVGNDLSFSDAVAKVNTFSFTPGNYTSFEITVSDDFRVSKEIPDTERGKVGMAVRPFDNGTLTPSGDLDLPRTALNIFPRTNGSFIFKEQTYFYKTGKDEGDRFRLYNITAPAGASFSSVPINKSTDYIILDYNNYFITSKGTSGNVTFGGDLDNAFAVRVSDHRLPGLAPKIGDMQQIETDQNYISGGVDAKGDYLRVGGISGSNLGAMWFKETVNFGGSTDYCSTGECFFKTGIRAFFTLEYSGCGEGLMFALFNGTLNNIATVGGDVALPELLGYGGDSRLDNAGSTFLDTSLLKGIQPPKIGLEFDAKVNIDSNFEKKPVDFCSGGNLIQNTRNDPGASASNPCPNNGRDNVQYVYWGSNSVNVPCRSATNPIFDSTIRASYDDNRHDPAASPAEDWFRTVSGVINTSPAITSDGKTIYIGSNDSDTNPTVGHLYAFELDADGYPKPGWETPFFTGTSVTSPVLSSNGTIYVGSGTRLYAFAPDKSIKPGFPFNTAGTVTKPTIGGDGTIYIVANVAPKFGYVYAIRPDGSLKPGWTFNPQLIVSVVAAPYVTAPVMSADNSRVYVAAREGSIYAFRATNGSVDWQRQPGGIINAPVGVDASAVYTGTNDKKVYALNATNGSIIWTSVLTASEDYSSSPVVASGTVYIGNYDDHLYAINASNGTSKWQYFAAGNVQSTPFVDSNGTIYFGSDIRDFSDNNNVRALYSDGTEKWKFPTGGDVRGTPAVKSDGTVYIGSFNYNFYAINQFALPKSLKNKSINYNGTTVGDVPVVIDAGNSDNWLKGAASKGPWAVRMEVYRSPDPNITAPVGYYKYELRSWVRQCNQADCSDLIGTFYDDTQVTYSPVLRLPQMTQTINLSSTDNTNFQRFLFGFSSQTAAGDIQTSTIRNLKLSFVRPTSPVIVCDPNWPEGTTCP
jgi:outer membrane protein assembly factor BamB